MKKPADPTKVLSVFAQYGFRKVSMNDIATAAGLSRQSIYNQYGSKENVLDCSVNAFLSDVVTDALRVLQANDGDALQVLSDAFQAALGDHIWILQGSPHGSEILDMAMETAKRATTDYEGLVSDAVAAFALSRGLAETPAAASDAAYVLMMASRGLLRKSETSAEYRAGMTRVLHAFFRQGG